MGNLRIVADVEGLILSDSLGQSHAQNLLYKKYEPNLLAMRIFNISIRRNSSKGDLFGIV